MNFFAITAKSQAQQSPPLFPRTFTTPTATFHLNLRPDTSCTSIEGISIQFSILDLLPVLCNFFAHYLNNQESHTISGRRGPLWNASALFKDVRVWHSVRVQMKSRHSPTPAPPNKLFASPPSNEWPNGQCDTVIFLMDSEGGLS